MFSNFSQSAMELEQPCPQGTGSRTQDIPDVPGENSVSGRSEDSLMSEGESKTNGRTWWACLPSSLSGSLPSKT